jgi:hypothetical protein
LFHPIIGRILGAVVELLGSANDAVYHFEKNDKWGDWTKKGRLYFAAWWPLTAPIGLVFGLLALIYGLLIKGLFR